MQKRLPSELISYLIFRTMKVEGATYGYEIIKRLKEISNGYWNPSYGTIYGALNRMEKKGLIERTEQGTEDRKYYSLTDNGEEILEERKTEIKNLENDAKDMVLGFLNVYNNIYGNVSLDELLDKIKKEFEI
ncbi:MAG: PadR family transcriptional regulator [Thermoplasmatota archaeon]